jgi:hypothetical protein
MGAAAAGLPKGQRPMGQSWKTQLDTGDFNAALTLARFNGTRSRIAA